VIHSDNKALHQGIFAPFLGFGMISLLDICLILRIDKLP
jgi:hypothetical protein